MARRSVCTCATTWWSEVGFPAVVGARPFAAAAMARNWALVRWPPRGVRAAFAWSTCASRVSMAGYPSTSQATYVSDVTVVFR